MLRKPELRRTWKDPLIRCLCRLDKANLCTNQDLLFGHKINREHSYKKQQPSYHLHARFKQRKTLRLTFTCFFSHWPNWICEVIQLCRKIRWSKTETTTTKPASSWKSQCFKVLFSCQIGKKANNISGIWGKMCFDKSCLLKCGISKRNEF